MGVTQGAWVLLLRPSQPEKQRGLLAFPLRSPGPAALTYTCAKKQPNRSRKFYHSPKLLVNSRLPTQKLMNIPSPITPPLQRGPIRYRNHFRWRGMPPDGADEHGLFDHSFGNKKEAVAYQKKFKAKFPDEPCALLNTAAGRRRSHYPVTTKKNRARKFTRVGGEFYVNCQASPKEFIRDYVHRLPSLGKTIK